MFSNAFRGVVMGWSFRQLIQFLLLFLLAVTFPGFVQASASDSFRREVESLLGATVQTKQGVVQIRQKRDENGRVRRLFVSGRGFSELQMDENGDGTVDFLEVTKGTKSVTATQPYRGRFLRLVVSERSAQGRIEATYILEPNGRKYSLLKSRLFTPDAVLNAESEVPQEFEATEAVAPSSMNESVAAAALSTTSSDGAPAASGRAVVELPDDESWRNYQAETWGPDLLCVSDESAIGRLAMFQRQWWKALKYDYEGNSEKLKQRLSHAKFFDESCRKPGQEANFKALASALSDVMMSSSRGESLPSASTRGRFLRCLELSGMGQVAAKIEMHFLQNLDGGNGVQRPLQCDFRPGQAGMSKPAFMYPDSKHIKIQLAAADQGKPKPTQLGSPINYQNILFHELIHVAGVASEDMTHAAQACCGDPSNDRPNACAKLDNLVREERRFLELETFLARSGKMDPLYSDLYRTFDDPFTGDLYRKFVLGLDVYKKGSAFEKGLLSNEELNKCLKTDSEVACREKWTRHIADYTAEFFSKECRKHVPAAKRKECLALGKNTNFQNQMAVAVSHSLIRISADPAEPGAPGFCGEARIEITNEAQRFVARVLRTFGLTEANASNQEDCDGPIGIQPSEPTPSVPQPPPVSVGSGEVAPAPRPTLPSWPTEDRGNVVTPGAGGTRSVVPGDSDLGGASGGNSAPGGDRAVGSGPRARPPRNSDRSPLPVSEVTSPAGARNIADRTYRRATDVAGLTTRGLRDLRNSILPRAIAGERDRRGRVDRGEDPEFLAFRPSLEETQTMKIENPFANSRALIIASSSGAGAGSVSSGGTASVSSVAPGNIPSAFTTKGGVAGIKDSALKGASEPAGTVAKPANDLGASASSASHKASAAAPQKLNRSPANIDIEALLKLKYSELEPRLNEIAVQQALIDRKTQIIRANGSIVGAKREVRICYKYAGQDATLKTPCE